jgi:glycosyltransferase involved in cell wall biosynthesis
MRIGYVYDAVYPWETGGVQKRVWEVARRLAQDHDVHWFGLRYWDGPPVIERDGVVLHGVGPPRDLYVDGRRSIPEALSYSRQLVRPLLGERFDVVDCQEFPYFPCFPSKFQSLVRGSTLLVTWHEVWGDYWYEYLGRKGWFGKTVERLTARLPDAHVAVSNRTKSDLEALGVSNARLVPNGIDLEGIRSVDPVDREVDVLFVGRFIEEKNADLVIRAVAELREDRPDVQCVLVGDGPERGTLASLVDRLDIADNVSFSGRLQQYEDVIGLMKAADVLALPSRREGFGITALEALACGTPVVTISHPQNAAQELVEDGVTGSICDATPAAVADGIRKSRDGLSARDCVATAETYDWNRIARRLETIYREVS